VYKRQTLVAVRDAVRTGEPGYADATVRLRQDAAKAMQAGPFTVMAKPQVPPSGDKHDYMSLARYFWPDPKKPDGLPYVQRDGVTNPEIDTIPDKAQMNGMISAVSTLALAYDLTGEEPYAAKAAGLVRAWYLDPATRMNPNLDFGQGVKGREPGRPYGIIDAATYYPLFVAVAPHYPDLNLLEAADRLGGPTARAHRANLRFGRAIPGPSFR